MQTKLFDDLGFNQNFKKTFDLPNAEIIYYPSFFSTKESNEYLRKLKETIDWQQEKMNIYGKEVKFPRLTAWYGENDKNYSFSGIGLSPKTWTTELQEIKNKIEKTIKTDFNSVLLNLYRNGQDSISWHTDAEKELGKNPIIASISFGEIRKFQLKHKYNKDIKMVNIELLHGSLLIMSGETQHFWLHQIPKTKKVLKERINLTFRKIK